MLYVEVNTLWEFERNMPKSRLEAYSYEGLQALYDYWDGEADGDDIEVSEELDYPCTEYDSLESAANDCGILSEIYWDMVNDYLMDKGIDIDDVEDWMQYIEKLDEDEVRENCLDSLQKESDIRYIEELDNGHVFIVKYEC